MAGETRANWSASQQTSQPAGSFLAREARLASVGSTNDVVRGWLAEGTPEVCLAVADEQTAGRGREGRRWVAPSGAGLLMSVGFRPTYVSPERVWRLAAIVALAMADAAEEVAGLRDGTIKLKWPNDLVVEAGAGGAGVAAGAGLAGVERSRGVRKLGGVLGETEGLGTEEPTAIVGIGVNVDWAEAAFPPELAADMTSLRAVAGRPVDRDQLLEGFLLRLEPRLLALREGLFDIGGWLERQIATGRLVRLEQADGSSEVVRIAGADGVSGALLVADPRAPGGERSVLSGEIRQMRLADEV